MWTVHPRCSLTSSFPSTRYDTADTSLGIVRSMSVQQVRVVGYDGSVLPLTPEIGTRETSALTCRVWVLSEEAKQMRTRSSGTFLREM